MRGKVNVLKPFLVIFEYIPIETTVDKYVMRGPEKDPKSRVLVPLKKNVAIYLKYYFIMEINSLEVVKILKKVNKFDFTDILLRVYK